MLYYESVNFLPKKSQLMNTFGHYANSSLLCFKGICIKKRKKKKKRKGISINKLGNVIYLFCAQ